MATELNSQIPGAAPGKNLRVKIFGVGTAGSAMVEALELDGLAPATVAIVNTELSAASTIGEQLQLEAKVLCGLGTGGDPERGRQLAEEHFAALQASCANVDVVFLVAGLGGGTGTGASAVLARAARESGALVLAFVTLPFACEGHRRQQQALSGVEQLQLVCDGVIALPNQKACQLLAENVSFLDTFRATARLLIEGVRGAGRLLQQRGLIEIHFAELCAVLRERHGASCFATLEASGATRVPDILRKLATHPLLEGGQALEQATSVLVSILGGPDLALAEVNELMEAVTARGPQARIIMGAAVDESFQDRLAVTLIATQATPGAASKPTPLHPAAADSSETAAEFGAELLHPTEAARPRPRLVPPAPVLTGAQREEIIAQRAGKVSRGRKPAGPRLRQGTLPLDLVNKGRFDKSEPTIHKGEDLDLPTYVRRGVALN